MITSPPSAMAGSVLYMPLAPTQTSSYIAGSTDITCWYGLSTQMTWRWADRSAAADQLSSTPPTYMPATPSWVTTEQMAWRGRGMKAVARLMALRTAVSLTPMMLYEVSS